MDRNNGFFGALKNLRKCELWGLIKALYQSEYAIHFKVGEYLGFTATASCESASNMAKP